jgi:ubiquinol-cytochrome c reductase cytochrome c subunit
LPPHVLAPLTLVPAVVLALAAFAPGSARAAQPDVRRIWLSDCAVCHAPDAGGTELGPSLHGVGEASVDYELTTGRMPLVAPTRRGVAPGQQRIEPDRKVSRHEPAYDADTVAALVRFVGSLIGDTGPPVPEVRAGDVTTGGELFRESCAACHSWSGEGGALLHREAPALHQATPVQTAEAIRVGPGQMPAFGSAALTDRQVDDVVAYVQALDHPEDRGGLALRHLGPVAEGAVGLVGLAVVLLACRWIGDRA